MNIIQNESRWDNLKKLHEMQEFFDDVSGELGYVYRSQRIYELMQIVGFVLVTMSIAWRFSAAYSLMGLTGDILYRTRCMTLIGIALILVGFIKFVLSFKSEVMRRYTDQDLLLFWLLGSVSIHDAEVNKTKRKAVLHTEIGDITVRLEGYEISGNGVNVETVDLDKKIVYIC